MFARRSPESKGVAILERNTFCAAPAPDGASNLNPTIAYSIQSISKPLGLDFRTGRETDLGGIVAGPKGNVYFYPVN